MLSADLLRRVDHYWAGFLGCSPTALRGTGQDLPENPHAEPAEAPFGRAALRALPRLSPTVLITSERSPGLVGLKIAERWILSLAPGSDVEITAPLARAFGSPRPALGAATEASAVEALREIAATAGLGEVYGPAQVLYCEPGNLPAGAEAGVRRLTAADAPHVERFRAGMGQVAWSLDDPGRWMAAFGLFAGDVLASAAAIRVWGDCIGEIFVDTLPQDRRRGYATMVTRTTTRWLFTQTSLIPQHDAELTNPASLHVAQAVGYEPYGWLLVAGDG